MGVGHASTAREEGTHCPTRAELDDLFRPVERGEPTGFPPWMWQDARKLREHRHELGAGIAHRALVRTAARLQAAIREGGRP